MKDVFELEPITTVQRNSYIISYPHICSYFKGRDILDAGDLVRGAHMVYGWMPTVLDVYPDQHGFSLSAGAELLNKVKKDCAINDDNLKKLKGLINNSLVGTSKLLHFVSPDHFGIWDSKIYAFVFEEKGWNHRVNKIPNYREYMQRVRDIIDRSGFRSFHESAIRKVGYDVSKFRAVELIMFLNAPTF